MKFSFDESTKQIVITHSVSTSFPRLSGKLTSAFAGNEIPEESYEEMVLPISTSLSLNVGDILTFPTVVCADGSVLEVAITATGSAGIKGKAYHSGDSVNGIEGQIPSMDSGTEFVREKRVANYVAQIPATLDLTGPYDVINSYN